MCNWKHLACVYPNQGIVLTGSYANASKLDTSDSGGGVISLEEAFHHLLTSSAESLLQTVRVCIMRQSIWSSLSPPLVLQVISVI